MLTKKRQTWAEQQGAESFKGSALAPPTSVASKYEATLSKMIDEMIADYERQFKRAAKPFATQDATLTTTLSRLLSGLGDKWSKVFAERAQKLTDTVIGKVDRYSKSSLNMSLKEMSGGLTLKTPDMTSGLYDRILASTRENVGLIKSIPAEYQRRITGAAMRSIQTGGFGSQTLYNEIRKTNTVTKNRAKLIAVDQTRKIASAMNDERMKSAGVKKFEWIHSGGGAEPRELHVEYDGQIFDLNDPPVIDKRTGQKGLPGELIHCRCKMRPVLDFTQYLDE